MPAQAPVAAVAGVAIDSLRGGPLAGAIIMVSDAGGRQGATDSAGRFLIDSIPPGPHRLALFHPLLDLLDVSVASPPIQFVGGQTMRVTMATPLPGALLGRMCAGDSTESVHTGLPPTAIIGRVVGASDSTPKAGATVTLVWTGIDASKATGVVDRTQSREVTSDAAGRFAICGPPGVTQASLRAVHSGSATGLIPIALSRGGVVVTTLRVTGSAHDARAVGTVVDPQGKPVAGATLEVVGADAGTSTDAKGAFALSALPEGTQTMLVRANGYGATSVGIDLAANAPWHGTIQLNPSQPTLATVHVSAERLQSAYDAIGFTQRKRRGVGTFMTAEDIENKHPQNATDVFENVPGLYIDHARHPPIITGSRGRQSIMGASGACVNLYVDGQRMQLDPVNAVDSMGKAPFAYEPLELDRYVELLDVAAVEVYNPSELPAIFERVGDDCQTIVIWTKAQMVDRSTR